MSKKKKWGIGLVALALVIAAVFPVRAAVREYEYQKMLARTYAGQCKNVEYLKLRLDWMAECIDQTLNSPDPVERRSALRRCYTAAGDFYDQFSEMDSFRFEVMFYGQNARYAGGEEFSEIWVGFNSFFEYCEPYLDGALELSGEEFATVMTACREDVLWIKDCLDRAFPENWVPSDQEFVSAWSGMAWDDFQLRDQVFPEARAVVQARSQQN